MNRILGLVPLFASFLATTPLHSQEPLEGANVFGDLSAQRLDPIVESRKLAIQELAAREKALQSPDISKSLECWSCLIATSRITGIQFPVDVGVRTKISFHVEDWIRGKSEIADFDVESRWDPAEPRKFELDPIVPNNFHATALDRAEPRVGDRYILGYSAAPDDKQLIFIWGAISLQDHVQLQLIDDVERFLTIESEAAHAGNAIYLDAIDDQAPWIRDIAVHRFTRSNANNSSATDEARLESIVRRRLQSTDPGDRQQALFWLGWIDSYTPDKVGHPDGLPVMPNTVVSDLLDLAMRDDNVLIADWAFERKEMFDMERKAPAGECYEIIPALRKTAHWSSGVHDILPVGFPLAYSYGCITH